MKKVNEMTKRKTGTSLEADKPKPRRINTLSELQGIINEPIVCRVTYQGHPIEIAVRALRPDEAQQTAEIMRKIAPPMIRAPGGEREYDFGDPGYLLKRAETEAKVRSLILYWCCPLFQETKPGLTALDEIHAFVRTQLTEQLQQILHLTIQSGGVDALALANFTTAPELENSGA